MGYCCSEASLSVSQPWPEAAAPVSAAVTGVVAAAAAVEFVVAAAAVVASRAVPACPTLIR